ncbi:MAG TPA: hypothetical protein VFV10_18155 [Gammaproteobacteria bacterium]|nr:hypothetical protein [Gammaproteobacteria bacterium]
MHVDTHRSRRELLLRGAAAAVAIGAVAAPGALWAQSGQGAAQVHEAAAEFPQGGVSIPQGIPNISGAWERYRARPGEAGAPPPEPPPPLKPDDLKAWQDRAAARRAADAAGQPLINGNAYCLPDGMPGMMSGPFPFEFLQSPGEVAVVQEAYNQIRRIYLDKPQMDLAEYDPGFYGRSVGHWENGVLTVDTIGVKDTVRFRDVPHSPKMRISERIHLATPDILWDEITIDDPDVLTKPWQLTFAYKRMPGYEILEYVCEDNREGADENGVLRLNGAATNSQ